MAVSFSTKNVRFITYPFSTVNKISVGASSKAREAPAAGAGDARTLNVRIPRKNIVVNVSPGISVAVLPEFLDIELLVCSLKFYFRVLIYYIKDPQPWHVLFHYP